ncbi:hypothetical protein WYO_3649 [Methylobacterium sp. GXF4]|nr:hypothetical protein WYO_3649 [Methylobacterium sp. GXF4]
MRRPASKRGMQIASATLWLVLRTLHLGRLCEQAFNLIRRTSLGLDIADLKPDLPTCPTLQPSDEDHTKGRSNGLGEGNDVLGEREPHGIGAIERHAPLRIPHT